MDGVELEAGGVWMNYSMHRLVGRYRMGATMHARPRV